MTIAGGGYSIIMSKTGNTTDIVVEEEGVERFKLVKTGSQIRFTMKDTKGAVTARGTSLESIPSEIFKSYPGLRERIDQSFQTVDQNDLANPNSRASKLAILKTHNPSGYRIISRLKNKETFDFFSGIEKGESVVDALDTGVHEGLHVLDSELEQPNTAASYMLIDGTLVSAPKLKTFYRNEVLSEVSPADRVSNPYVETYLDGDSGRQGLEVLLDELNAYAHGALTTIELSEGLKERHSINPGLVAMMEFTSKYLMIAENRHSATAKAIQSTSYGRAIEKLWTQAEKVLNRACASNFGSLDRNWKSRLQGLYAAPERKATESTLKRELRVPENCR